MATVRDFHPGDVLRPWIAACWTNDATGTIARVLPDGCADIIFDLDRDDAFVVGTMTRPLVVEADAHGRLFGIRFRPGRLSNLFRMPLSEVTDARVPLREIDPTLDLHPESIAADLQRRLTEGDRRVDAAVALLSRTAGRCDIDRVAEAACVTRQHLGRLFARHVGVSPKTFARIVRFRHALRLGRNRPCADVAALLGYSDQSHLIAEFREFSGTTPVPFFLSTANGDS
ncbi:MAG TPA: helix-turn-helix transcriptional regulator [Thermoanaerobaculia bacterium]|jgi:AraC-like DNA-binding protein